MTKISNPILFFGTEDFSLASLKALLEHGFAIVGVVTKPDTKRGRGRTLTAPAVKTYALEHNIPVYQPQKLAELTPIIAKLQPVTGVLVSFGKIIPQSTINLFTPGIINVHPSLLPSYRGPSPIESAIANGDTQTGVTIMSLVKAMDAGPIYTQKKFTLKGTETQPELYETLAHMGAEMLVESLPAIMNGSLTPTPQDDEQATYCALLSPEQSLITPTEHTAVELERIIRAHLAFPRSKYQFGEHRVTITKAHVAPTKNTPLDIQCRDGAFLCIDELIAPSGKTMSAESFLRGYSA